MKQGLLAIILSLPQVAVVGQPPISVNCRLTAESTPGDPGIIRLTVNNVGEPSVVFGQMSPENTYRISLTAQDGTEPVRTAYGEQLRRGSDFGGSVIYRDL